MSALTEKLPLSRILAHAFPEIGPIKPRSEGQENMVEFNQPQAPSRPDTFQADAIRKAWEKVNEHRTLSLQEIRNTVSELSHQMANLSSVTIYEEAAETALDKGFYITLQTNHPHPDWDYQTAFTIRRSWHHANRSASTKDSVTRWES